MKPSIAFYVIRGLSTIVAGLALCSCGGGSIPAVLQPKAPVATAPIVKHSFVPSPGHHYAYFGETDNTLNIVDLTTLQLVDTIALQFVHASCAVYAASVVEGAFNPTRTDLYLASDFGFFRLHLADASVAQGPEMQGRESYGITVERTGQYVYETSDAGVEVFNATTFDRGPVLPIPQFALTSIGLPAAAASPTSNEAYFGSGDNSVVVVDTTTQTIVAHIAMPAITDPLTATFQTFTISGDGSTLYVAHGSSNQLIAVDTASRTIKWQAPFRAYATTVNHSGSLVYASNVDSDTFGIFDAHTGTAIRIFNTPAAVDGIDVSSDDTTIYMLEGLHFVVADALTGNTIATIPLHASGFTLGRFVH